MRTAGQIANYALLEVSTLTDDCLVCDRLSLNAQAQVKSQWPGIQAAVDQSNGTFLRLYRLRLNAAPAPQFLSVSVVTGAASVRLAWQSYGGAIQVERAPAVDAPYSVIASNVSAQAYDDIGVLANAVQYYYRLRLSP